VDIWHFIMSQGLEDYKIKDLGSIEALAEHITALPNFSRFTAEVASTGKNYYEQIEVTETLMRALFCDASTEKLMETFINVAIESGLNLNKLYALYIGKNILNQFRQDHGYKEGSYIKIWNGKEDNVTMQKILAKEVDIAPDALYCALEKAYPEK